MNAAETYEIWAPRDAAWSAWAKPIVFTALDRGGPPDPEDFPRTVDLSSIDVAWAPDATRRTAVVADLAGPDAVDVGLALARRGYRPVPLFNGCDGPSALVDVSSIVRKLALGVRDLRAAAPPDDAPPAFLLDARRDQATPSPGKFDNRWVVLPQDFPSATFLSSRGIGAALLVQRGRTTPRADLAHVLLRWQQAEIVVSSVDVAAAGVAPQTIVVAPPPHFRSVLYGLLALAGLRRGSAGGFGALVPLPPASGVGGGVG